jgi:uncharacterized membrane protein
MFTIPLLPSWQTIHPMVIHFPIALLLIAPIFIIIAVIRRPEGSFQFLLSALILIALGTAGTFVAAASGSSAGEVIENVSRAKPILERHEELAETVELAFSALTLIFASIIFIPRWLKAQPTRAISTFVPLVFLLFYATGGLMLVNTAHEGGRLVHELGVSASLQSSSTVLNIAEH